jgi:hypothetical protein
LGGWTAQIDFGIPAAHAAPKIAVGGEIRDSAPLLATLVQNVLQKFGCMDFFTSFLYHRVVFNFKIYFGILRK